MPKKNPLQQLKNKTDHLEGNIKLAILFVVIICLWMLTGLFTAEEKTSQKNQEKQLKTVQVLKIKPENYTRYIEITGTSQPDQMVSLAARTESQVTQIIKDYGERVEKGETLLLLDPAQREETLKAAQLDLKRAQGVYKSASKLNQQGYRADTSLEARHAELALAQEALTRAKNDLSYTEVQSPIKGLIEERSVDVGDYIKTGEKLYTLVSLGTYIIETHVSQKDRNLVSLNETAFATLANGQEVSGTITFVATNAHETTRTYKVEIEVKSPDVIPTGMSAKVRIPTKTTTAYLLPYASMVLNDEGRLGAMILENANITKFKAINPIDDNGNGVYITGLNTEQAEVVVKGQASVIDGETVQKTLVEKAPEKSKAF